MKRYTRIIAGLMICLLIAPTIVLGFHNGSTHPHMTNDAVDFLNQQFPGVDQNPGPYQELVEHSHFNVQSDPQLAYLDEGSVKEDRCGIDVICTLLGDYYGWDTGTWGTQSTGVPGMSWSSHGWNPLTGEVWYGIPDWLNPSLRAQNAYGYARDIWGDLQAASQSERYFHAGRLAHLIQDMASPAHVQGDTHLPPDGDDLENYLGANNNWNSTIVKPPQVIRQPSTHGYDGYRSNSAENFIHNVAWRTYYMTTYYGSLRANDDPQPDSELKRMFPSLRWDDGGFWDAYLDYWVINQVGRYWNGAWPPWDINDNEWWRSPRESSYYYIENLNGGEGGNGTPARVASFKKPSYMFTRLDSTTYSTRMQAYHDENDNDRELRWIYRKYLVPHAVEWTAGFLKYFYDSSITKPPYFPPIPPETPDAIPEPGTFVLFGVGLLGLLALGWRRWQRRK